MCAAPISVVALTCSAIVSDVDNCDVFAPPGSDAFNDCQAIYDCLVSAYKNYTIINPQTPPYGTLLLCPSPAQ
jgi:hypothetical protein